MPVPRLAGFVERRPDPPETLYCPECDLRFQDARRDVVERLFDEHLAEVRNPELHTKEPF